MAYTTIDDPSEHFNTILWTGNGGTNAITGVGFKPDWVWGKDRVGTDNHHLFDTTRGTNQRLISNSTAAENTETNCLDSFDSDGFTLGSNTGLNANGEAHVAWNWKANGGTTASNTSGSTNSTVQADTTAGFSIVTHTGTGSGSTTVGHGLGKVPAMIIVKDRGQARSWNVYHQSIGNNSGVNLNGTGAQSGADSGWWNNTSPTSSVFTLGTYENESANYVSYCFAEIQGYSKFSSYTGNGNADGPFVYTGFRPAFLLVRNSSNGGEWGMFDTARNTFNVVNARLSADSGGTEYSGDSNRDFDFLSNGIKVRNGSAQVFNTSGQTHIYMAFAEHPFVSSEGVPVTAR